MEHYFSAHPKSASKESVFSCRISGLICRFHASGSVFSKDHIDPGTFLLVQSCLELDLAGKRALDLGCGMGTVGVFIKKKYPSASIVCSDVNQRALSFARRNFKENIRAESMKEDTLVSANVAAPVSAHVSAPISAPLSTSLSASLSAPISILAADGFSHPELKDALFDMIAFNPPQHAGKKLCNRLIVDAAHHLSPGGSLLVVARHNKGGSSFCAVMKEAAGNAESMAKKGMFRVYRSVNKG